MANDVAIRVEGLGKRYRLGERSAPYRTLRETIMGLGRSLRRRASREDTIWALRDVDLEIRRGEVLGVIGRNGAGKTTLLKILSRITEPTTGRVELHGRVGSLLEVGTGFHPELTGRENIYLNGAILGMRRAEIGRKFDEIVAFAEIERFLDTPVKHYSSGMYVRLAFAVAAHLEPEILLVDEVLAVGDAVFQKKCLGKMGEVAGEGRTVIFVSHQLDMVRALCHRCVLLSQGLATMDGDAAQVVDAYGLSGQESAENRSSFRAEPDPTLPIQIVAGSLLDSRGRESAIFDVFEPVTVELEYVVRAPVVGAAVTLAVSRFGSILFYTFDTDESPELLDGRRKGRFVTRVSVPVPLLKPGTYTISLNTGILNSHVIDALTHVLEFQVELVTGRSSFVSYAKQRGGVIAVSLPWQTSVVEDS